MRIIENPSWCPHAFWEAVINLPFNPSKSSGFFQAFTEILLITGTSWISWWISEYPHKDMQNPNELTSSSIFSAFHMDVTLSVSLEEPVPTFINTTLPLSYEQKNIMTHSANIYKHILSKSQNKVSTDWQRKLPSTPTQHGASLLSYRWPSGRWDCPPAHCGGPGLFFTEVRQRFPWFWRDLDWIIRDLYLTYFEALQPVFKQAESMFEHHKRYCHNRCFQVKTIFLPPEHTRPPSHCCC